MKKLIKEKLFIIDKKNQNISEFANFSKFDKSEKFRISNFKNSKIMATFQSLLQSPLQAIQPPAPLSAPETTVTVAPVKLETNGATKRGRSPARDNPAKGKPKTTKPKAEAKPKVEKVKKEKADPVEKKTKAKPKAKAEPKAEVEASEDHEAESESRGSKRSSKTRRRGRSPRAREMLSKRAIKARDKAEDTKPAADTARKELEDGGEITQANFKAILDELRENARFAFTLSELAGALGPREMILGQYKTSEIRQRQTEVLRSINAINKLFRDSKKKRTRKSGVQLNNGFKLPRFVSQQMIAFFQGSDLGYLIPNDPKSGALSAQLDFLSGNQAPTTPATLTPLFAIYAHRRKLAANATTNKGLPEEKWNKQLLAADERLLQCFGPVTDPKSTFGKIYAKSLLKIKERGFEPNQYKPEAVKREAAKIQKLRDAGEDDPAKLIISYRVTDKARAFSPSEFLYADFQSIISNNFVPEDKLTVDQKRLVEPLSEAESKAYQELLTAQIAKRELDVKEGRTPQDVNWGQLMQDVANRTTAGKPSIPLTVRVALQVQQLAVSQCLAKYRQERLDLAKKIKEEKKLQQAK